MQIITSTFGPLGINPRSFSDPLTSTASFLKNFIYGHSWYTPIGTIFASQTASIGAAVDLTNALLWSPFGQGNPNQDLHSWVVPHIAAAFFAGKNQFCQLQRVAIAANGATFVIGGGVGCLMNFNPQSNTTGNGICGYRLYTLTNASTAVQLRRENGGNSVTDIGGAAFNTFADGDVLRLEAVINSPTSVTLTCFNNGVQKFQVTDNPSAAFDPTQTFGVPIISGSIISGLAGTTGSPRQQWRNFTCGLL